jgi:hypothetical protein
MFVVALGQSSQSRPAFARYCGLRLSFVLLLFCLTGTLRSSSQHDVLDPDFAKIPFDQWLSEGGHTAFHFTVGVPHAALSYHQRLMSQVEIKLDGKDLDTRRGDGKLLFLIQVTDPDGTRFQDHGSMELNNLNENIRASNVEYSQRVFLLPGEYRLAVALLYTASGEHSVKQTTFRVAPSTHDFLTNAWHALPPVEFIGKAESPDSWYLPDIQGRLQWASGVHSPVRLNVILNVAPAEPARGSHPTPSADLAALLPTLKALSQTGSRSISEYVELLDLPRRHAVFHEDDVHDLDWTRLKSSLSEANTASIDIHSLSGRKNDAQFFVSEVRKILRASDKPSVLVVLTAPVAFESGEDLDPISVEALPDCRVIYLRYRAPQELHPFGPDMRRGRSPRMGGQMPRTQPPPASLNNVVDQLAGTLKPLSPKVLDVDTPEQIMKAMVEIEKALLSF